MMMSQEDQINQLASSLTTANPPDGQDVEEVLLDIRRQGSFDCCWKMLAEKIMDPHFWVGAEQFLARNPPLGGHPDVREALARHVRHLFGAVLRWEDLLLVPNEVVALEAFVHGFCAPGDVILCPVPFADPELAAAFSERTEVEFRPIIPLEGHQQSSSSVAELDLADLERAQRRVEEEEGRRVRALLLHNPHPLFGSTRDSDRRLARVLEWTNEHELFLLVAESLAAMDLWEFSSCLGLDHGGQSAQRLIWLWSGADHFSLPGLEFAALLVPKPERLHPFVQRHPCAPLVQFLTAKLLEDFDWASELFARRKSRLDELRRLMLEGLRELGIRAMEWHNGTEMATQWILMNLRKFLPKEDADSEVALREEFAKSGKLLLISGQQMGMDSFGWFRLRCAESEEQIRQVLARLLLVLEGKKKMEPESEAEWERMDLSKYGGKGIVWDQQETEERAMEEEEVGGPMIEEEIAEEKPEEEEETFGEEALLAYERQWNIDPKNIAKEDHTVPTSSAELFREELWQSADGGRRMSLIREEEEEDELLRQVFIHEDRRKAREGMTEGEEEEDEVISQVFSIFPAEKLRWKKPLVEEMPPSRAEADSMEGVRMEVEEGKSEDKMDEEEQRHLKANEENLEEEEEGEDVRNGLDVERVEEDKEEPKKEEPEKEEDEEKEEELEEEKEEELEEYKPRTTTTLTDFSFIEELVYSSSAPQKALEVDENEFYDEASTEEEEREESAHMREAREEFTAISPVRYQQPLTVDVPILVEPVEGEEPFGESSDSKRIIEIIDQIFQDAAQIRDFSSPSNDSHPNHAVTVRQEHSLWSRSDSGLAADSPPDLSFSPTAEQNQQLHSIEEGAEQQQAGLQSPEPTRNEALFFDPFREGPLQSSTLAREAKDSREEAYQQLGPVGQMLDDSGIFVEMLPGSLSIDFPLRVPAEHLRRQYSMEEGMEEPTSKQLDEERDGLTVDLQFMVRKEEEEELTRVPADDLVLMEYDQQQLVVTGSTTVYVEDEQQGRDGEVGWEPLESLEPEASSTGLKLIKVDEQFDEEEQQQQTENGQAQLVALLSEGSSFCASPIGSSSDQPFAYDQHQQTNGTVDAAVPVWKPLDQLEEEERQEQARKNAEEEDDDGDNKFSEALDEMEAEEWGRGSSVPTGDFYTDSVTEEKEKPARRWSREPTDVVAEWNAQLARKKAELEEKQLQQEVDVGLSLEQQNHWTAHSAITLPYPSRHWAERKVVTWEEKSSTVEEVREEGAGRMKTVIKLNGPEKPTRTFGSKLESREEQMPLFAADEKGQGPSTDEHLEIPGRSQAYQIHHRMQMRRREHGSSRKKLRTKSRDRVILEHMNITEVNYNMGGLSERLEKGERLVTCISTRINRYTPDEFFRRLPIGPNLDLERGRLKKYVETRLSRSHSVPSMSSHQQEGKHDEIRRMETVTVTRLDDDNDEEAEARATGTLHCGLSAEDSAADGDGGRAEGRKVLLACQNPEHIKRDNHCDPTRLYTVKRSTAMSENGYKKMKRGHDRKGRPEADELYSQFQTTNYELMIGHQQEDEAVAPEMVRKATAKHRYRRPRRPRSPSRITVTTTRDGGDGTASGECIDRVTVRHTPGSNWVVSSIYRTTEYGWQKTALKSSGAKSRRAEES